MARQVINRGNFPNDHAHADSIYVINGKINDMTADIYALMSRTVSVSDIRFVGGVTPEARINLAIIQAKAEGAARCRVSADHLPYNADLVNFDDDVQMTREGGIEAGGVWDAAAYGGKVSTLGYIEHAYTIREAVKACAANGGGTVDCQGFPGDAVIVLATDICGLLNAYDKTPITFVWGSHEVRIKARQIPRSHHHQTFHGTHLILKDETGARVTGSVFPFYTNSVDTTPAGGVNATSGSAVVTMATPSDPNWTMLEVGSPLLVNGFVPPVGVDKTTINVGGGIDASTTTITVVSTTWFATASDMAWPQGGRIRIESEIISYTSKDATHFLGCTRGAEGSTAAAHADTTRVDRVSYQPCTVLAISGSSVTLDVPMNVTATNLAVQIGALDVTFDGVADFDGNKNPVADDTANPQGLWINGTRGVFIGSGLTFRNWDHGGWTLTECQDCVVFGRGDNNGSPTTGTGVCFWVFGWNKRLTIDILEVSGSSRGLDVDDRSTLPTITDGPCEDSSIRIRRATRMGIVGDNGSALLLEGTRNCIAVVERAQYIAGLSGCNGIHVGGASQWADETTVPMTGNIIEMGTGESPDGTYLAVNVSATGNGSNVIIIRQRLPVAILQPKNVYWTPPAVRILTYGTTVNTDTSRSEFFTINATDGVAFTIANPTQLTEGRLVEYYISNGSGGAMGAVTMGSKFRLAGAFTAPANGNGRIYRFRYRQTSDTLIEEFRSPADQLV